MMTFCPETKSLPTNCLLILDLPPYILCFGAKSWWQYCQFLSDVGPLYLCRLTYTIILPRNNQVIFNTLIDGETQKTVHTQIILGMFIVKCPIRAKKRTHRQTMKPPTEHTGRLDKPSHHAASGLVSSQQTVRFPKYFWYSKFSEFHSKLNWLT